MQRVYPISVCLIVKNEEAYLDSCLKSVKDWVNEIIVVDTGSTDRTVEIAKENGAKVSYFDWIGDFAAARNESLSKATNPFILQLDADEEVMPQSLEWFAEEYPYLKSDGYYCDLHNLRDAGADEVLLTHRLIRFFRNSSSIRFKNKVHENIIIPSNKTSSSGIEILHKGYGNEVVNENKIKRNLDLLLANLRENPTDAYTHYYLSQSFSALGRTADAYKACIKSLKYGIPFPVRTHVYRVIFNFQAHNKLVKEFEKTEKTLTDDSLFPEIVYYRAVLNKAIGNVELAKVYFNKLINLAENPPEGKYLGEESFIMLPNCVNALTQLGLIAESEQNIPLALTYMYKAVDLSPMTSVMYSLIARYEVMLGNKKRAIEVLDQAIQIFEKQLMNIKQKELIGSYRDMMDKIHQTI